MNDDKINKIAHYVGVGAEVLNVAKVKLPNVLKNTGKKVAFGFAVVMLLAELAKVVVVNLNKQEDDED